MRSMLSVKMLLIASLCYGIAIAVLGAVGSGAVGPAATIGGLVIGGLWAARGVLGDDSGGRGRRAR
jgi:hypothetical protein